jgi:hypothetical protein
MKPKIMYINVSDMQVCVPEDWTDEEVKEFANTQKECWTGNGWAIVRKGNKDLKGGPEREPCADQPGFVNIRLEA